MASDLESWTTWFARHGRALLLYARQWARDLDEAEDLVQEAFARFWLARHRVADPLPFLYACLRHVALDEARGRRRRGQRERWVGAARASGEAALFETPAEQDERRQAIEQALQALPAEQREVLVLKVWAGLTFAQVGAALGISPNTAASRYRYGLEALHELLPLELRP